MTVLIYFICFFAASLIQAFLRILLKNGSVPIIPGSVIFYLVALFAARKWSNSYKEKKEIKKTQDEHMMSNNNKESSEE